GSSMRGITFYKYVDGFDESGRERTRQPVARNRLLLAAREILDGEHPGAELVFAGDQGVSSPESAGGFERLLQAEGFVTEFDDEILAAQLAGQPGGFSIHARSQGSDVDIGLGKYLLGGFAQRHDEAIFADGETDAGGLRASQGFGEAIVAAAAQNRVLRAQGAVRELECGAGVVIETAHQAVVEGEGNSDRFQNSLHLVEVLAAGLVEKLSDAWQRCNDRLVFGNFAVEHAQRIGDGAALAVGAHFFFDGIERLAQGFVVAGAVGRAAPPALLPRPT